MGRMSRQEEEKKQSLAEEERSQDEAEDGEKRRKETKVMRRGRTQKEERGIRVEEVKRRQGSCRGRGNEAKMKKNEEHVSKKEGCK